MKKFSVEIKWAVIFTIVTLLWMLIEKSIGLHDVYIDKHPIYTNLFAIPAIIIFILALSDKKKNFFNGQMDWKQGFVSGIIISFFITLLSPIAQYISLTFITPDYFKNIITYTIEHNLMTLERASNYFNIKNYIIQAAMGGLSMGVLTSALVAFFIKTKRNK
jgi:hypothetical protein